MSPLTLDPLQRVTRSVFHEGTTPVMAFCDESHYSWDKSEDHEKGPYLIGGGQFGDDVRAVSRWFDDVDIWKSVYEEIGFKGVAFDVEIQDYKYPNIVPEGEEEPESVSVVNVLRPPALETLTQFRPVLSRYFAPGVDPRFYIFVDNSGSMETEDIQPTLDEYLAQLREWRVPYRVIEINVYGGEDLRSGLGAEQWLQWLCAPFVGGFDLGHDDAIYEDWTP